MKNNIRKWLLSLAASGLLLVGSNAYSAPGDVQGRDLDYPIITAAGHIGLEQYGNKVYEMLTRKRTSDWGYRHSGLFNNSVSSLKNYYPAGSDRNYWGAKYWEGFESPQHSWRLHDYILPNSKLMYEIGANYVYIAPHRHSSGTTTTYSNGRVVKTPYPGEYRCDSFVKSMYRTGGLNIYGNTIPATVYNNIPSNR